MEQVLLWPASTQTTLPDERELCWEGAMDRAQINELLYQSLETEIGGVKVYKAALRCVQNDDLKEEWEEYLEQTENHERIMRVVCKKLGLDPEKETPGRANSPGKCGLIGALPVACGITSVPEILLEPTSWGSVKARYR